MLWNINKNALNIDCCMNLGIKRFWREREVLTASPSLFPYTHYLRFPFSSIWVYEYNYDFWGPARPVAGCSVSCGGSHFLAVQPRMTALPKKGSLVLKFINSKIDEMPACEG